MTIAVVPMMSTEEAQRCVDRIRDHLSGARSELLRLYEAEGWRALGYESWRECVVAEFGQSQAYLYRQLSAAQIESQISPMGEMGQIPERQLRPLTALGCVDDRRLAWGIAEEFAAEHTPDGKVTASLVEMAAAHVLDPESLMISPVYAERASQKMAVHYSSDSSEWYTPPKIIAAVLNFFDAIDLDPCAEEADPKTVPARVHFTAADDGLSRQWFGRVYMNPPYGDAIPPWVAKLDAAYRSREIEAGIALVPSRTDTDWFEPLYAYTICFVHGRLKFSSKDSAPFPSALVYVGDEHERFAQAFRQFGAVVRGYERSL